MKTTAAVIILLLLATFKLHAQFGEEEPLFATPAPAAEPGAGAFVPAPAQPPLEAPGAAAVATFRVELFIGPAGQKLVRIPQAMAEGREISGVQHGIDQNNQHVVFNADSNLGNPKRGEFIYPVLEGAQSQVASVKSIRDFVGLGTLFEPLAFDYKIADDGRIQREMLESKFKQEFDTSRVNDLRTYFDANTPPNVDRDTYDAQAWAEWTYFYQQLTLWENYIAQELLKQELLSFTSYDARVIDDELTNLYESHKDQADGQSQAQNQRIRNVIDNVARRENARALFRDWLTARERDIDEFAENFDNRQKGTLLNIDGQVFIVSEEPQGRVPTPTIGIVTDVLTPHDLLTEDGELRHFEQSQDLSRYE